MAKKTTPNVFFTPSIHPPERGRRSSSEENVPSATKSTPIPSANTNSIPPPSHTDCSFATTTKIPATIGPTHGAAMIPATSPIRNDPTHPAPPIWLSLV